MDLQGCWLAHTHTQILLVSAFPCHIPVLKKYIIFDIYVYICIYLNEFVIIINN